MKPLGYSVKQLNRYYRYCVANPAGNVLPPGGRAGWDDMTASAWMNWFRRCLMAKIHRNDPPATRAADPIFQINLGHLARLVNGRYVVRPSDFNGLPDKYRTKLAHRVTHHWEE